MQQKIGMKGTFTGAQRIIDNRAILFRVFDRLVQDVVLAGVAGAEGQMSHKMRTTDETHIRIAWIGVVNSEPNGDRLTGGQRPITGVLVPRNRLSIAGHLAKEVGAPTNDILTQQITDKIDDGGVS